MNSFTAPCSTSSQILCILSLPKLLMSFQLQSIFSRFVKRIAKTSLIIPTTNSSTVAWSAFVKLSHTPILISVIDGKFGNFIVGICHGVSSPPPLGGGSGHKLFLSYARKVLVFFSRKFSTWPRQPNSLAGVGQIFSIAFAMHSLSACPCETNSAIFAAAFSTSSGHDSSISSKAPLAAKTSGFTHSVAILFSSTKSSTFKEVSNSFLLKSSCAVSDVNIRIATPPKYFKSTLFIILS